MAWLDFFRPKAAPAPVEAKASAFAGLIASQYPPGQAIWTPENYESLARRSYRINPYVFTAIRLLSQGVASVPWVLSKVGAGGALQEVEAHPLLALLANPNPAQGWAAVSEAWSAYYLLSGNGFLELVAATPERPPVELWVARSDRMQAVASQGDQGVGAWEYRVGGMTRRVDAADVVQLRSFNPLDDWYGMPPILAALRSSDAIVAAQEWHTGTLQNSARPSGILKVKASQHGPEGALDALVSQIRTWVGGRNSGKPAVLAVPDGGDVDWQQAALDAKELDFLGGIALSARQVGLVFGVPSVLLGDVEAQTFANYAQARKALWEEGVIPLLERMASELNRGLAPRFGDGLVLRPNLDGVGALQEDQAAKAKWVGGLFAQGLLTQNEGRLALGWDEAPEGDRFAYEIEGLAKAEAPKLGEAKSSCCEGPHDPKAPALRLVS